MAGCTALACPRSAYWFTEGADPNNKAMSVSVPSTQLTRDKTGHTWCNYCQKHRELMDYGHAHHWPEVQTHDARIQGTIYLLLADEHDWFSTIACSNQEAIDDLYAELIGNED